MIRFSRTEKREINYSVSLRDFMDNYYAGADIDNSDDQVVIIYVHCKVNTGNMTYVFDVPLVEGKDIDNDKHVEQMIRNHQKEAKAKLTSFTL